MAGVSPWFFTVCDLLLDYCASLIRNAQHYGKISYNKNFVFCGDDWLLARRWELLVKNRDKIAIAQIVTWNDYGESSYVGPIEGVQPQSQAWTNGFDNHQSLEQTFWFCYKG